MVELVGSSLPNCRPGHRCVAGVGVAPPVEVKPRSITVSPPPDAISANIVNLVNPQCMSGVVCQCAPSVEKKLRGQSVSLLTSGLSWRQTVVGQVKKLKGYLVREKEQEEQEALR